MKDSLTFEGKIYISARRAARIINYSQDYIGQLCRSGKIISRMVGRTWFVEEDSLYAHRENAVDATRQRVSKIVAISNTTAKNTSRVSHVQTVDRDQLISKVVLSLPAPKNSSTDNRSMISREITDAVAEDAQRISRKDSGFVYASDENIKLPEIVKKVPPVFSLHTKDASKLFHTPYIAQVKKLNVEKEAIASPFFMKRRASVLSRLSSKDLSTRSLFSGVIVIACVLSIGIAFRNIFTLLDTSAQHESGVTMITEHTPTPMLETANVVNSNFNGAPQAGDVNFAENSAATENAVSPDAFASGIVVVPSTNSQASDQAIKEKIASSFSDDVTVQPDQSGTSGVITPIFKTTTGNQFVYVLVPVKQKK